MFLHHFEISSRSDDKTELQPTKNRKDKKDTKRLVVLDFIFLSGRHVAGLGSFSASILSGPREIEYFFCQGHSVYPAEGSCAEHTDYGVLSGFFV